MRLAAIFAYLILSISAFGQMPESPAPVHDTVAPWSINFNVSQRYINTPAHFGDAGPGMLVGRPINSSHTFDKQIGVSLVESLDHNRVFWSAGYAKTLENGNQTAVFNLGFRAFEFGRRR